MHGPQIISQLPPTFCVASRPHQECLRSLSHTPPNDRLRSVHPLTPAQRQQRPVCIRSCSVLWSLDMHDILAAPCLLGYTTSSIEVLSAHTPCAGIEWSFFAQLNTTDAAKLAQTVQTPAPCTSWQAIRRRRLPALTQIPGYGRIDCSRWASGLHLSHASLRAGLRP